MAYGFNEDRSKALVYSTDESDENLDNVVGEMHSLTARLASSIEDEVGARMAAVGAEATARERVNSRIDEIILGQDLDPNKDSELVDIRSRFDGETDSSAGTAVRNGDLSNARLHGFDGLGYDIPGSVIPGTPFFKVDHVLSKHVIDDFRYNDVGEVYVIQRESNKASEIYKAPRYLGIKIPSKNGRIGTMRVGMAFYKVENDGLVCDEDLVIWVTSSNAINYLNAANSCIVELPPNRYFRYQIEREDDQNKELEMIWCDVWPDDGMPLKEYTQFSTLESGTISSVRQNSRRIPAGCFYAAKKKPSLLSVENTISQFCLSTVEKRTDVSATSLREYSPFGFIGKDDGFGLLWNVGEGDFLDCDVYCSIKERSCAAGGPASKMYTRFTDITDNFRWTPAIETDVSDSEDGKYWLGKEYFGIPYASRWTDAHFFGFEVSPTTMANAIRDQYSIFYDETSGRSAKNPTRGGPGYGQVCSAFNSLICGNGYPQTNVGFTWDENFRMTPTMAIEPGTIMTDIVDHCVFVASTFENGYSLYEGMQPVSCQTIRTGNGDYRFGNRQTRKSYLDDYHYTVNVVSKDGFNEGSAFLDFDDIEIPEGPVRPWRGHKCVYGPFDKSSDGLGIWATIHDPSLSSFAVETPSGTVHTVSIPLGETCIDIGEYVEEDGVYTLSSGNPGDPVELFKYRQHDSVALTFEEDGSAVFTSEDVDYCYASVSRTHPDYSYIRTAGSSLCIANTAKHPCSKYPGITSSLTSVRAAMAYDEWGRYAVPCSLVN